MKPPTQTRPADHWAADEIVAPELVALKAWYDGARGARPMLAFAALPYLATLPGAADLALVALAEEDGSYLYLQTGEGYRRTAAVGGGGLQPRPDGRIAETRPVMCQHLDLAAAQRAPFHVSVTRWDGLKILQYDRLILPLDDGQQKGMVTHLLVGECFLRLAKDA
ncbi:MAG TPA: hypothetical protein VF194_05270 [Ferrovibrio sp.]|jgi:hypothetical protein|uniref:hypothetical protein n=1 Tax=Ferrovibrio sp. TaxID=1917215 RepID=UPI002ED0777B